MKLQQLLFGALRLLSGITTNVYAISVVLGEILLKFCFFYTFYWIIKTFFGTRFWPPLKYKDSASFDRAKCYYNNYRMKIPLILTKSPLNPRAYSNKSWLNLFKRQFLSMEVPIFFANSNIDLIKLKFEYFLMHSFLIISSRPVISLGLLG